MTLKCLICKDIIFPEFIDPPESNIPDTWTICEKHEEWTDQENLLFQKAVSDLINVGKPFAEHYVIRVDKPQTIKKYPVQPFKVDDTRYATDALDI